MTADELIAKLQELDAGQHLEVRLLDAATDNEFVEFDVLLDETVNGVKPGRWQKVVIFLAAEISLDGDAVSE
jgi:hypothetical protein